MTLEAGPGFEQLLDFLRQNRGFDFTGYKRATLVRRVGRRAQQVGVNDFSEYLDYLEVHPEEYPILFNTILINVTEFFRDESAWQHLAERVIPDIVERSAGGPIRVWSAGSASGEEAYGVAMLMCDALGPRDYVERVKIYATDIDDDALATARLGYPPERMTGVSEEKVKEYFDLVSSRYIFKPGLRRTIIFGRHDLLQDAPISRVDLLICRNTLMYFTAESQGRILARFHYALTEHGYLFLGRAEMLLTHSDLFTPAELKHRLFRKVPRVQLSDRLALMAQAGAAESPDAIGARIQLRAIAGDQLPVGEILLDAQETVIAANEFARTTFHLSGADVGRPLKDLELSYRPVELRSRIETAVRSLKPVVIADVEHYPGNGVTQVFDVHVLPLAHDSQVLGTSVIFRDVTEQRRLERELERVRQEVETANEELQSSHEELETTNEELQSTVEELETTNEELQSANEELETMNEELESTNSELQTINNELRGQTEESERATTFLEAILKSMRVGIAVLDKDLKVLMWNAHSHELWGVSEQEAVGKGFFELDVGLPLDQIEPGIAEVAQGREKQTNQRVHAINRRGRTIECRVTAAPLSSVDRGMQGVIVMMEALTAPDSAS